MGIRSICIQCDIFMCFTTTFVVKLYAGQACVEMASRNIPVTCCTISEMCMAEVVSEYSAYNAWHQKRVGEKKFGKKPWEKARISGVPDTPVTSEGKILSRGFSSH